MQVVKTIEAVGTQSGKPRKKVVIADCGELPSKRMILKRLRAEKEELAKLKEDPFQVPCPSGSASRPEIFTVMLTHERHQLTMSDSHCTQGMLFCLSATSQQAVMSKCVSQPNGWWLT